LSSQIIQYSSHYYFTSQPPLRVTIGMSRKNSSEVPLHTHDFVELVIMVRGKMVHDIRFQDGTSLSYGVWPGNVFSVLPGETHGYRGTQDSFYYNILFLPEMLNPLKGCLECESAFQELFCASRPRSKLYIPLQQRTELEECCTRIISEFSNCAICYGLCAQAAFHELVVHLCRGGKVLSQPGDNVLDQGLLQVISAMESHPERHFAIADLAKTACMSESLFYARFHDTTGLSPQAYLLNLRLEKSMDILRNTDQSIAAIATQCGFCDSNHFIKLFRRRNNLTPLRYRLQFR